MKLYKYLVLTGALIAIIGAAPAPAAGATGSTVPNIEAFHDWLENNQPAVAGFSTAQRQTGQALAKARRAEMKALIQRDPATALGWAVSAVKRSALPREIADELETQISGTGYVGVLMSDPATETNAAPSVSMTVNGQVLRVFLHGSQLNRKQWYGEPVKGIVLDDMAVMEDAAGVSLSAAALIRSATKTVTRTYTPDRATIAREGEFDRIGLDGLTAAGIEPGMPSLPREFIHVALPPGVTVKDIRVSFNETKIRDGVIPAPAQRAMTTSESGDTNATPPDAAIYSGTDIWPTDVATLAGDNNRAGHRYVSILIHPLRYIGATKSLYGSSEVTVSVDYELPVIEPASPSDERIVEAKASVQRLVVNPEEVQSPSEPVTLTALADAPQLTEGGSDRVDYLIITSDELVPAFTNLAAHRQAHDGFVTAIRTVSDITNSYAGADAPTSIRNCIIDYYTTSNLQYVVLGGDAEQVPVYYAEGLPSDLYYSGLDAHSPQPDFAYEVIVGRIPVQTPSQAEGYIGKVVDYDTNPPWQVARKTILTGSQIWDGYSGTNRPSDLLNDGHMQFQDAGHPYLTDSEIWTRRMVRDFIQTNGNQYVVGCLLSSLTSWYRSVGDYAETPDHLVEKLDYGWNMWIHNSHGSVTEYATALGWGANGYGIARASEQTNLTVMVYANSCDTADFDSGFDPCLGEALLRNPQGGVLIYLGSSRFGYGEPGSFYGGYSNDYITEWLKQVFVVKHEVAGKAFAEHKLAMAHLCVDFTYYRSIQFSTHFLGDPALRLMGAKPAATVQALEAAVVEGSGSARFVVRRDPAVSNLTVQLSYSGPGASAPMAQPLPTSITFTNGQSDQVVVVSPLDDGVASGERLLSVSVVPGDLYEPGGMPTSLAILDATNIPVLALSAPTNMISEWSNTVPAGAFTFTPNGMFTITRAGDAGSAVTVHYTISGTARTNDYLPQLPGSVTLAAGQSSTNLSITAVDNVYGDGDRSLVMTLQSSPAYDLFGTASSTITILDNDPLPTVTVTAPDASALEHSVDTGVFRVSRTGDPTLPLTVNFALGGSCAGNRYTMPASPVTIPSGSSSADLTVTPLNDTLCQPQQEIVLTLVADESKYSVGSPSNAGVTMYDDDNLVPQISLSATPTNYEVGDSVLMEATVSDDWGISNVVLTAGTATASFTNAPYRYVWTGGEGSSTIGAVVTDSYGATATASVVVVGAKFPATGPGTGFLAEWWTNVVGTGLASLTNDPRFVENQPDGSMECQTKMVFTMPSTNSCGIRLRAFFIPPKDGLYSFVRYSGLMNDSSVIYLSPDESPDHKIELNYSSTIWLKAGRRYYLEYIYKHEGYWTRIWSGISHRYHDAQKRYLTQESPIPYYRLSPWYDLGVLLDTNAVTVSEGGTVPFQVSLSQAPTGTVNVGVSRAGGDSDISVQGPTNLVFDPGNWNVPQGVTLAAAEDADSLAGMASILCSATNASPAIIMAWEVDNETNTPPVAVADSYMVFENNTLSVGAPGVLGNDTDAETNALTAALVSDPTHGAISLDADGSFTYEPAASWSGTDSFTYQANDGQYDSDPATVTLTVLARPHVSFVYSLTNLSEVIVGFDRPVKTTPAEAVSNYTIDQGVSVLSADLDYDQQTVRLMVSGLAGGKLYTLTVNNVSDYATGVPIQPNTRETFMVGVSVLGGLFPLPYQDTYESYARGSNLAGSVWTVLSGDGAQAAVAAATPPVPASGYPVPEGGHTNAMDYFGPIMLALDGTTTSNLMTVALDTMIRPVLGAPTGDALAAMTDGQAALYFDTNGFINVFHGVRASSVAGPPDSTAWLALTNALPLPAGEWCRLTVVMSYDVAGPMAMFAVAIDSNLISAAEGYVQASLDSGHGGPWFISPTWDAADLRLHSLTVGGGGWLDDLKLTPGAAAQMAIHGVPVVWMQATGLDTNMNYPTWDALSLGDPDGDGLPTWQEYIAGTDPNRASSVLNIVSSPIATPAGELVLRWTSSEGRTYAIQRSTNLVGQSFGDLWTGISATPPENTYTGTVTETAVPAFYRISVDH